MKNKFHKHMYADREDLFALMRRSGSFLYHRNHTSNSQDRILHILLEQKIIEQNELQKILDIKAGSISEIVSKLEKKEYLIREKDLNDRRKIVIKITDEGLEYIKSKEALDEEALFNALNEEQKVELKKLLKILLREWY